MATASAPYNPLDEFQSYSTHFVLLACRTTVAAKMLTGDDPDTLRQSGFAIERVKHLGGAVTFGGRSEDIYLVLDTRRFSQFTVENLKYDVYVNGLSNGANTSNLAADLSMTILDSVGISFANFMQTLLDDIMKTNYDGIIFMLRTIFVGHTPDGKTETIQTETIPMHLNKMDINLDFAKGSYVLEFMPNMNFDVNKYNRFLTISTTTACRAKDNSLGGMVMSLQDNLNANSRKYYDEVQALIPGGDSKFGRRVQYLITLPENWGKWKMSGAAVGGATEIIHGLLDSKQKAAAAAAAKTAGSTNGTAVIKDSHTTVQPGITITNALDLIFEQIPEIVEMGNFTSGEGIDGYITFYKHIVGLSSSDDLMMVHVDVIEFKVPNLFTRVSQEKSTSTATKDENEFYTLTKDNRRVPKDFIEWEYIFTGKNKDILNFDMKIEDFQFLLASNLKVGATELQNVDDKTNKISNDSTLKEGINNLLYARKYDPLVLPLDTAAALKNFSSHSSLNMTAAEAADRRAKTQQYTKNLSMFYAASPVVAVITIKGNPLIMHKFNIGTVLDHTAATQATGGSTRSTYREDLEDRIIKTSKGALAKKGTGVVLTQLALSDKSYATSPVFARVNIKGPNVDSRTNEQIDGDYATSVLSDNYYVVFKLTNIITNGVFTQELELYVHNVFGRPTKKYVPGDDRGTRGGT